MPKPSLRDLEFHDAFVERHIGPNDAEIAHMLGVVGHASLDALTDAIVPASIKSPGPLALPAPVSESGNASGVADLIEAGTMASVNASSESWPTILSIAAISASFGPTWRSMKASWCSRERSEGWVMAASGSARGA